MRISPEDLNRIPPTEKTKKTYLRESNRHLMPGRGLSIYRLSETERIRVVLNPYSWEIVITELNQDDDGSSSEIRSTIHHFNLAESSYKVETRLRESEESSLDIEAAKMDAIFRAMIKVAGNDGQGDPQVIRAAEIINESDGTEASMLEAIAWLRKAKVEHLIKNPNLGDIGCA